MTRLASFGPVFIVAASNCWGAGQWVLELSLSLVVVHVATVGGGWWWPYSSWVMGLCGNGWWWLMLVVYVWVACLIVNKHYIVQ